jgi:hypothetical protein
VKEDQCYVCKRTENEVMELLISNLGPIAKKYASEIIQIKSTLKKVEDDLKSHVDAVLKIIEDVRKENLEFSLSDTFFANRDKFKKVIPNIDELEKIRDQYSMGKISYDKPFSDWHNYFMNIRKHMDDKNSKEHLEDLENFQALVMRNSELKIPMNGLNLKFFESGRVTNPEQEKSEEENKKIVESINTLEKLIDEEIYHGVTSNQQLKSIEKLTHRKIFRSVLSSDGFFPKIGTEVSQESDAYGYHANHPGEIIQTQFSIDVCAICYTLVWHTQLVVLKETPPLQTRPPPRVFDY